MENGNTEGSRIGNSLKNMASGFLARIIVLLLGFVTRTFFIKTLGVDYLGVNGLYSNILNVLSLAELGFGSAMIYSMYAPIANHDHSKINALLALYKTVYRVMGIVILTIGLCLIPVLPIIIKNPPQIGNLTLYYVLFLLNSSVSYFAFAYKGALLRADQKTYVVTNISNVVTIAKSAIQVLVLLLWRNFVLYLLIQLFSTIAQNIVIGICVDKKYSFVRRHSDEKLNKAEIDRIKKDIKGLATIKIGHVVLNSTDNIIISSFVGLAWVGLLDNYNLLIATVTGVLCIITEAIQASLGNYFVSKSKDEGYNLFLNIEFINSWLYAFCSMCFIVLFNPFIELWIGQEFWLTKDIVIIISVNFFVQGYMNTLSTFRSALGLFSQGWLIPIAVAVLNIALSIALSYPLGMFGVLIATFISRLLVNLWYDPLIIYKYGFNRSIKSFYIKYLNRIIQFIIIFVITTIGQKYIIHNIDNKLICFGTLIVMTIGVFGLVFWLFNHRSEQYKNGVKLLRSVLGKIVRKPKKSR